METLYRAVFIYTDGPKPVIFQDLIQDQFMKLREKLVKQLNPYYATWNEALKGVDHDLYSRIIRTWQKIEADKINEASTSKLVQLDIDEDCDIIGRIMTIGTTIHLELQPVKEKA